MQRKQSKSRMLQLAVSLSTAIAGCNGTALDVAAPDASTASQGGSLEPTRDSSANGGSPTSSSGSTQLKTWISGGFGATTVGGGEPQTRTSGTYSSGGAKNIGSTVRNSGGAKSSAGTPWNSGGAKSSAGTTWHSGGAKSSAGTTWHSGGAVTAGGSNAAAGSVSEWPNIRVVGNHLHDRWGKPFAVRGIESMFGNGTSNAAAFAAGHHALGANAMGPLPNSSVSDARSIEQLLAAAYNQGLILGLNADHTNQGVTFFQSTQIQAIVNRYPNVFLQESIELGTEMTASQWVQAAKDKIDAYVTQYPDKPLKIGSPFGGRSPRYPLDHCQEVVDYYYSKSGRGGLIFTCQLYWKASNADWSYQEENGFQAGLAGILEAIDAMIDSPCLFIPGLDHQDDVGYTGWREVMDHVRESHSDPRMRLGFQWWVYYNSGDPYDNDLTSNANDALAGITSTGRELKAKFELDRQYVELGPLNP